jgi:hypothetical protein
VVVTVVLLVGVLVELVLALPELGVELVGVEIAAQ